MSFKEAVEVPESLAPFVEIAAARLRGLHPHMQTVVTGQRVWVQGLDEASAKAAAGTLLHLLYQERIYSESREVRTALYDKLLGA